MEIFEEKSLPAIFQNQAQKYGNKACVAYKKGKVFQDISWQEMNSMIRRLALYLDSLEVKKGDRIAIFSNNCFQWWVADQAILSLGAVNVPVYSTNTEEELRYVLKHSGTKICFAGQNEHLKKVLTIKESVDKLQSIISFQDDEPASKNVASWSEALKNGANSQNKNRFDDRLREVESSHLATIMYTSGTTGDPKGVMLSHGNLMANIAQIHTYFREILEQEQVMLSFLPLSHSLERLVGYYLPISARVKVVFAEDLSTLRRDLRMVRPTFMVSVPRIYEKVRATIMAKTAAAPPLKRFLFNWALKIAAKNLPNVCQNKSPKGLFKFEYMLADKLIFSKIKDALGMDRLKHSVSGGAPLAAADAEFFLGMGIVILEGFGLTETSPVVHVNRIGEIVPGSVGRPVKDTLAKLDDHGEVLVKGPQVMQGYYHDQQSTDEVMTEDGYFKTGDIGSIDQNGCLTITGRIKDIIVTSGGKNISPQNIENCLKFSALIEQVAVLGDNKNYLTALVIPNFEKLHLWAKNKKLRFSNNRDLIELKEIKEFIAAEIEEHTSHFSRVEQVKKFILLEAEWTQQTGELTPTQKVKRRIIEKKYASEIEAMYS